MKVDDPRLTGYALGELSDSERGEIEKLLSDSPEAQQFVSETRHVADMLKAEYVAQDGAEMQKPANLIDIRDDPWLWSIARPLAIAAVITAFAVIGAISIAKYKSRSDSNAASAVTLAVEGEEKPQTDATSEFAEPENVRNPLPANLVEGIERVVIGELDPATKDGEIRVIETISDAYRVEHLKKHLTTPMLSKRSRQRFSGRAYQLLFIDRGGHVVAGANFSPDPAFGFALQLSKCGYERDGRYFGGGGDAVLPGVWKPDINYSRYIIPFRDWIECVGYSPGV